MKKIMRFILYIVGLPKILYLNFKCLPFIQAVKIPIFCSPLTKFICTSGKFKITQESIHRGMIRIGFDGSSLTLSNPAIIDNKGLLIFNGNCIMGGGTAISCNENAVISFGNDTKIMGDSTIISKKLIKIGDGCRISWKTQIIDTDFHRIFKNDICINEDLPIHIGKNVWICSRASIYKGVSIANGVVISSDAQIKKDVEKENCIVTGMPVKIIVKDIRWEK